MQQLQPLRPQLHIQQTYAREIATRPGKAGDESRRAWVCPHLENDRYGRGRRLCRECRRSGDLGNHGHLATNQIGFHSRQSIVLAPRPTVFDRYILAFDITGFTQAMSEGGKPRRVCFGRRAVQHPNYRHRQLLRARSKRPCGCSAAESQDELAPPHSITSSAVVSSDGGTVRPSALAVLRLMTSSNLTGC